MDSKEKESIRHFAGELRKDVMTMIQAAGSGHPGGSLSSADAVAVLYRKHMHCDPENPSWEGRDRFVLSKGHCVPLLYAVLAETGYIPKKELLTLRKFGSRLQGHPECQRLPGVEISSGSLGQGLSVAGGMALGLKVRKKTPRVYCLMGDGEIQEGQIWEAAMAASHYRLDNLCGIVDSNKCQIDGRVSEVMGIEPLADKFRAFGWHVLEIDGHDIEALDKAFTEAEETKEKPTMIVIDTVKGKGVSYLEDKVSSHYMGDMTKEQLDEALAEIDAGERR